MLNPEKQTPAAEPPIGLERFPGETRSAGPGLKAPAPAPPDAATKGPPLILRLDGVRRTAEVAARVRARVDEINRQLERSGAPFRLRVM